MADGRILFNESDHRIFIRLTGDVRHTISSGFQDLIRRYLTDSGTIEDVLVDLSEAHYLDSTNLGLLAQVARYMIRRYQRKATLICSNPDILTLLETMGFEQVFWIVQSTDSPPEDMHEACRVSLDAREKGRLMLDAHRALMAMNAKNAATFRSVVELFEKELDPSKGKSP